MKLVLSNYHYRPEHPGGGHLHIEAFIRQAVEAGHSLHAWDTCRHPSVRTLPAGLIGQGWQLRDADLLYVRLHEAYPRKPFSRWFTPPLRRFIPRPRLVWEFNTIPEQGTCIGQQPWEIELNKDAFRRAAPHCDLAVCVSEPIVAYVREELGIQHTLVIPNGGHLRPPAPPPPADAFNVLWAGSAYIRCNHFELLLAAARQLHAGPAGNKVRFHHYGPGTEKLADLPANV